MTNREWGVYWLRAAALLLEHMPERAIVDGLPRTVVDLVRRSAAGVYGKEASKEAQSADVTIVALCLAADVLEANTWVTEISPGYLRFPCGPNP